MAELVLTLSRAFRISDDVQSADDSVSREMVVLGTILALLQILDGVMTGIGVSWFGTSIEGNYILRTMMESIGPVATLVFAKMVAISVVAVLVALSPKVGWLKGAMCGVIGLYLTFAIVPWAYILVTQSM